MEITKEILPRSKIKLTVKVPAENMRAYFSRAYNKLAPQVEIKGFRKGMAPKNLTISGIGENRLMQEIIDLALQDTYGQSLKKEKIIPLAPPKVNIKMMKDLLNDNAELEYEVEIEILPAIKLGDYKKIKIKKSKKEIKVSDREIEQVLSHLRRQHATFEEKDGPAEAGDRIEMDFTGTERGVVLENLTSKNYPVILGSKVLLPEFEKNILGTKKDEEKEFDLVLGKEQKKVHFKVKIHDVKKVILPPADDELAKKFQKNTLDALKKALYDDILKQKEAAQKKEEENQIIDALLEMTKLEAPETLVEREVNRMISDLRERASTLGVPFEQYLAQIKHTEEDLRQGLREQAEKTVKTGLILGEIAKRESTNWHLNGKDQKIGRAVIDKLLEYAKK